MERLSGHTEQERGPEGGQQRQSIPELRVTTTRRSTVLLLAAGLLLGLLASVGQSSGQQQLAELEQSSQMSQTSQMNKLASSAKLEREPPPSGTESTLTLAAGASLQLQEAALRNASGAQQQQLELQDLEDNSIGGGAQLEQPPARAHRPALSHQAARPQPTHTQTLTQTQSQSQTHQQQQLSGPRAHWPPSQQQQQLQHNTVAGGPAKKGAYAVASSWQQSQSLNRLQKYLSEHQQQLVQQNPGSLYAVARAIKMAIVECQYQMRNEPWDCPIYGFSIRPAEIFGMLMSRSFKETSFIQSLLSSAITHSVARACTESTISTCSRKQSPHGNGFAENFEFGQQFSQKFMDVTHELQHMQHQRELQQQQQQQQQQLEHSKNSEQTTTSSSPSSNSNSNSNLNPIQNSDMTNMQHNDHLQASQQTQPPHHSRQSAGHHNAPGPMWKERRLRYMINAHNDEFGRLVSRSRSLKHFPLGSPTTTLAPTRTCHTRDIHHRKSTSSRFRSSSPSSSSSSNPSPPPLVLPAFSLPISKRRRQFRSQGSLGAACEWKHYSDRTIFEGHPSPLLHSKATLCPLCRLIATRSSCTTQARHPPLASPAPPCPRRSFVGPKCAVSLHAWLANNRFQLPLVRLRTLSSSVQLAALASGQVESDEIEITQSAPLCRHSLLLVPLPFPAATLPLTDK